jgi:ribosomal protein L7/L12
MDDDVRGALEVINKRLDWIEESLGRVIGLQYTPMGRADQRPDETEVPPEIVELAQAGKTKEAIKRYRELTGASSKQAQAVIAGL